VTQKYADLFEYADYRKYLAEYQKKRYESANESLRFDPGRVQAI
jgi:hypothetical protein